MAIMACQFSKIGLLFSFAGLCTWAVGFTDPDHRNISKLHQVKAAELKRQNSVFFSEPLCHHDAHRNVTARRDNGVASALLIMPVEETKNNQAISFALRRDLVFDDRAKYYECCKNQNRFPLPRIIRAFVDFTTHFTCSLRVLCSALALF